MKQTGAPILNAKVQVTVSATEHRSDSMVTSPHEARHLRLDFQDWLVRFGSMTSEPMSVPDWFSWAVSFGYRLGPQLSGLNSRTTLVITTPCDSAIASAVALGMSLSCVPSADQQIETESLFDRFMQTSPGTEIKCLPRGSETRTQRYRLLTDRSEERGIAMRKLTGTNKTCIHYMTRSTASRYAFEDSASSVTAINRALIPHIGCSLFQSLLGNNVHELDWRASQNAVVVCAPALGRAALRRESEAIYVSDLIDECEVQDSLNDTENPVRKLSLADLLLINEWRQSADSECPTWCRYVNASTTNRNEIPNDSRFVIFNGPDAYLRLHGRFKEQSHLVFVSRDADANKLDRLFALIHSVRDESQPATFQMPAPPFGIQLSCLGSRNARAKQW